MFSPPIRSRERPSVFRGKRGDYVKILTWDGSGLCLFAKRLEKGKFVWPPIVEGALQLTAAQLALLLEGIDCRRTVAPPQTERPRISLSSAQVAIKIRQLREKCGCAGGAIVVGVVMSPSTTNSPRNSDDLRRLADDLRRDVAWLRAEVHAKALMIEKLRAQLAFLRRARFGRKSEKLDAQVEQLELMIDDIEAGVAETLARAGVAEFGRGRGDRDRRRVEEEAQAFEPRSLARPFAGGDDRPRRAVRVPDLRRRQVRPDRRGRARGARIRSLPLQARRARAAEDELPGVRDRRPGADADAADREGTSRPGAARPCRRVEVLRSSAAASPGRHLRPQRR